jgi:hypothetical protein
LSPSRLLPKRKALEPPSRAADNSVHTNARLEARAHTRLHHDEAIHRVRRFLSFDNCGYELTSLFAVDFAAMNFNDELV